MKELLKELKSLLFFYTKGKYLKYKRKKILDSHQLIFKAQLVNWLAKKYNLTSYLQISTYSTGGNFDEVDDKIFKIKECLNYFPENHNYAKKQINAAARDHTFKLEYV